MKKELLMLMILFQHSNAEKTKVPSFETSCLDSGGELLGHLKKICIEREYKDIMPWKPVYFDPEKNSTGLGLVIQLDNLQIIEIDVSKISLSMNMDIRWFEPRVHLATPPGTTIYLRAKDEMNIWSPEIVTVNNIVSQEKEREEFGIKETHYYMFPVAVKKFYMITTMKCDMDFHYYPFDQHVCILEVS